MDDIVSIMQFMAKHIVDDIEHLFETLFIEHMKIILVSIEMIMINIQSTGTKNLMKFFAYRNY